MIEAAWLRDHEWWFFLSWVLLKMGKSYSPVRNMSLAVAEEEVRKDKAESPNNGL